MAMRYRPLRFFLRLVTELSRKYTKALLGGFVLGIVGSTVLFRLGPYVYTRFFSPVERIAMVGEFTPTTLPVSVQEFISMGLTNIEPDGSVSAAGAVSWEATQSGQAASYIFHLREDLRWHDGRPFTAKDVNYNIRDVTMTPIDTFTLAVSMKEFYSPFPTLLARPLIRPGLIGLGSYKVESIVLNGGNIRSLRLSPLSPSLPSREYRFYRTEAQAVYAYKLGEVDRIEDVENTQALASWGKTHIDGVVQYDRVVALFFNLKTPILAEKSVRHLLAATLPDFAPFEKAYSPVSKTSWAYTDNVKRFSLPEDQIKKNLAASPLATSSSELTLTTFAPYAQIAEKIVEKWKSFGIVATIRIENSLPHDYQILLSGQNLPPDPDLYPFWHSTQTTGNITGYVNVKIDKLLEDGRKEQDPEKRKKLYTDFQRRLVEDAPAIFLYYPMFYSVQRAR